MTGAHTETLAQNTEGAPLNTNDCACDHVTLIFQTVLCGDFLQGKLASVGASSRPVGAICFLTEGITIASDLFRIPF